MVVPIDLVFSIYDSTEVAIQKMIEASQRMINEQLNSPSVNEHFKLQIKTLQNASRSGQIGTAFESKEKTKGRSNAHRRYTKVSYRN